MIAHRPPDELLLGYAAGNLSEPVALAIAAHAALCAETAAEIRRLDSIGGALLRALEPAALRAGALERALERLDGDGPAAAEVAVAATPETRALLPAPIWPYIGGDLRNLAWRRRGAGIETAPLFVKAGQRSAFLLRAQPGRAVPRHTHRGIELTLVLAGAFRDGADRYARGDIQATDPAIDHQPKAEPGEECICLVALDAPLRLTGPLGRWANPFIKL